MTLTRRATLQILSAASPLFALCRALKPWPFVEIPWITYSDDPKAIGWDVRQVDGVV